MGNTNCSNYNSYNCSNRYNNNNINNHGENNEQRHYDLFNKNSTNKQQNPRNQFTLINDQPTTDRRPLLRMKFIIEMEPKQTNKQTNKQTKKILKMKNTIQLEENDEPLSISLFSPSSPFFLFFLSGLERRRY